MSPHAEREAYDAFAYAYDQALGAQFFGNLRPHLERVASRFALRSSTHLDVACGTGHLSRWFAERGMRSFGIDASLPMAGIARARGVSVAAGDFRHLPLRGRFDVITSFYDSLNHLTDPSELAVAFREVRALLKSDGTFWFDMNHPSAYTKVWSIEEPFISEGGDYRLEIATTYERARRRGTGWVTGWSMVNNKKVLIDEIHYQRSYTEREIRAALKSSSLRVCDMFRFDPFHRGEVPVKFFFVAAAA